MIIPDYPLGAKIKSFPERCQHRERGRKRKIDSWSLLVRPPSLPLRPMGSMRTAVSTPSKWFRPFRISPRLSRVSPTSQMNVEKGVRMQWHGRGKTSGSITDEYNICTYISVVPHHCVSEIWCQRNWNWKLIYDLPALIIIIQGVPPICSKIWVGLDLCCRTICPFVLGKMWIW